MAALRLFIDATNRMTMIPVESVFVSEVGPGGVSSMRFTVVDPTKIITVARLDQIYFDTGSGMPIFQGYVTTVTMRPLPLGREIDIEATGVEALLDWLWCPTVTIAAATNFGSAIAQIVTAKTSNLVTGIPETTQHGNLSNPIGSLNRGDGNGIPFMTGGVNWTIPEGTLRWQIEELHRKSAKDAAGTKVSFGFLLTIDFLLRVRVWEDIPASATDMPDDYLGLVVDQTPGFSGEVVPEDLQHALDHGAVPNRVRVQGTGTVGFSGPNTFPGIEHYLNDPEILTAAERLMAGANYLAQNATPERGTFRVTDWTPTSIDIHAGSMITLNVANVDLTAVDARIMQIDKTFHGTGRQDWTVTYGRMGDSISRSVAQALGR